MTTYSGITTHHNSIANKDDDLFSGRECIETQTIFNVQYTNCPKEVENEVRQLWSDFGLNNDFCYFYWNSSQEELTVRYPAITGYLNFRDVKECLIHWWW